MVELLCPVMPQHARAYTHKNIKKKTNCEGVIENHHISHMNILTYQYTIYIMS